MDKLGIKATNLDYLNYKDIICSNHFLFSVCSLIIIKNEKIGNITLISTFQLTIVKYSQENDKLIDASEEI